ncbi:MAG: hypothetical protein F4132_05050 [Gemmatimonadetes bacterium]|nr:hypothetical protein [Gemmatimonadota bacterium]MYH18461.1 hypothetical protein [Gemmatimonadota bacterium]
MDSIPHPHSLSITLDRINERHFLGDSFDRTEAERTLDWLAGRFGSDSAYAGTFGLTEQDRRSKTYTFTGERLQSASLRHIQAEETCRAIILLNRRVGRDRLPELEAATSELLGCFEAAHAKGKPRGTFCCGPCTVSLWRHMAIGGLGDYARHLDEGIGVLASHEDGAGTWRRFPFYYTLLALSEVDTPNARRAVSYAFPECERRLNTIRRNTPFGVRRYGLLSRILEKNAA